MNPNGLPLYGLGTGPNVNMLDNILMAGGFPATEQPKPALSMPQYTYAQDIHHHAMNLVQPAQVVTSDAANPVHVIVYQNDAQQQQPISYKMAQIGTTVVQPQQQPAQIVQQPAQRVQYIASTAAATAARQATPAAAAASTTVSHVQRKKDIVAQAMQEQKIFEQQMPKAEAVVKQEPGVPPVSSTATVKTAPSGPDIKPVINQTKTPTKRQYNKSNVNVKKEPGTLNSSSNKGRVPLMVIDDDEDDGLTCRLCMASYWYKTEMYEHYKTVHSITDPAKYDKEEKLKKMKKMKEEQQRINMAKRQREERERRMNQKGRGMIKLTSPGARQSQAASARPSFQYRDGAFICDLCKESFSDGNDMVTHWKSHVKKQQVESFSRGRGRGRGRGRAMIKREDSSDDEIGSGRPGRKRRRRHSSASSDDRPVGRQGRGTGKAEKGKPRWTAYLLWSTRKRRDVVVDHPDWTFAQIAKWISQEWKQIDSEEKDELQKEAEEMNELGIRKLPRDDDAPDPEKDTTDEDSDFEEGYRRKQKVKVKRERQEGEEDVGGGDGLEGTSESDWEPEADIVPASREKSRSGRQRKRPSFFQEFESQENNLDNILAEFEQTQAAEFGKPRKPKPPPKPESERKPRKRRSQASAIEPVEVVPVEVETLRSGRKRKVRRVMNAFLDDEDEDDKLLRGASSDDDDFEPPPDEEVEKLEDEDDAIEEDEEMDDNASDDLEDSDDERMSRGMMALPLKKRGRPKKILTDYEIEEATRAAMYTRPSIEITKVPRVYSAEGLAISKDVALDLIMMAVERVEGPDPARLFVAKKSAPAPVEEQPEKEESPKFQWVNESLDDEEVNKNNVDKIDDQPESDALNPLESQPEEKNPLDDDEPFPAATDETEVAKEPLNEEDALLETVSAAATATVQPPFVNECEEDEEGESEANNKDADECDNPLGDIDTPAEASDKVPEALGEQSLPQAPEPQGSNEPLQSQDSSMESQQPPQPLSEEDLLTGPAHNLDDSQYKADYVDPNLEDIFK